MLSVTQLLPHPLLINAIADVHSKLLATSKLSRHYNVTVITVIVRPYQFNFMFLGSGGSRFCELGKEFN